jgi:hypothetical protein
LGARDTSTFLVNDTSSYGQAANADRRNQRGVADHDVFIIVMYRSRRLICIDPNL